MRLLFMGTPDFSVPTLQCLIESKHQVIAVVTQPDKPKGRGNKVLSTPVKELSLKYNIPVYQPLRVREQSFINLIKDMNLDAIIVIAFGQILPKQLLDIPKYGAINIHASLLPKYRGAGPIQWAVINGEKKSGLTTMMMDVGLDTGDMLLKQEIELEKQETGETLHNKLSIMGGPLVLETLDKIEDNSIIRVPQDNEAATYAPMLSKELGKIDWKKDAAEIERLIRGLNPWPTAYTYIDDKIMKIWKAEEVFENGDYKPGQVYNVEKNGFFVKCGINALYINELQLQGKKKMDSASFLRGVKLEKGTLLV